MGEIFTNIIEVERVQVNGMDNLCWMFLQTKYIGTIKVPIGTNNWDVDTYRNKLENQIRIQNLQVTCFPSGE